MWPATNPIQVMLVVAMYYCKVETDGTNGVVRQLGGTWKDKKHPTNPLTHLPLSKLARTHTMLNLSMKIRGFYVSSHHLI